MFLQRKEALFVDRKDCSKSTTITNSQSGPISPYSIALSVAVAAGQFVPRMIDASRKGTGTHTLLSPS